MSSGKSKIIAGSIIAILGFLGYLVFGKKSLRITNNKHETLKRTDKIQTVNYAATYNSAEEQLYDIAKDTLEKKDFRTPYDFLNSIVIRFVLSSYKETWLESLPNNVTELEQFLRKHELFDEYSKIIQTNC